MPPKPKASTKKTIAKAPAKKAATKSKETAMMFAPEPGSDLDLKARLKAVIAVLEDAPVSAAKAAGAANLVQGVIDLL